MPTGVYDFKQDKVLLEPLFDDISFLDDGIILAGYYDLDLRRYIFKVFDRNGNEKFKSDYSMIYAGSEPCFVLKESKDGDLRGLIDKKGNIIFPLTKEIPNWGVMYDKKLYAFGSGNNFGIKDFDGNTIVPAKYCYIYNFNDDLLIACVGEWRNNKLSLITNSGNEILPAQYKKIKLCKDGKHFYASSQNNCEMYLFEEK